MKRGYIIISISNRAVPDTQAYHKQAANLAISLKAHEPESGKIGTQYPIAWLTNSPEALPVNFRSLFSHVIEFKPGHDKPFYSKTLLNLYTPFDETIYIDADSLAIGDPDKIFDECEGWASCQIVKATKATQKKVQMSWVTHIADIYDYYKIPGEWPFNELNSSMIYWDSKSQIAKDIFQLAEHFYACEFFPGFKGLSPRGTESRGWFPDELAFECAMLHTRHDPPKYNPFYMQFSRGGKRGYWGWTQENKRYPLMTMPGGFGHSSGTMWEVYDTLRAHFARILGKSEGSRGKYGDGFKMDDKQKAANRAMKTRWEGLRPRSRPAAIKRIIKRYAEDKKGTGEDTAKNIRRKTPGKDDVADEAVGKTPGKKAPKE